MQCLIFRILIMATIIVVTSTLSNTNESQEKTLMTNTRYDVEVAPTDVEEEWFRDETFPYEDQDPISTSFAKRRGLWGGHRRRGLGIVPYYKHKNTINYGASAMSSRPIGSPNGWFRARDFRPYRQYIKRYPTSIYRDVYNRNPPPIYGGII